MEKWDVIVLSETWMDEKGWERIKDSLPKGYKWGEQLVKRRSRKGRGSGRNDCGNKKEVNGERTEDKIRKRRINGRKSENGEEKVKDNRSICAGEHGRSTKEDMEEWMEEKEVGCIVEL